MIFIVMSVIVFFLTVIAVLAVDFRKTNNWDHHYDRYYVQMMILIAVTYFIPVFHSMMLITMRNKRWRIAKEMMAQNSLMRPGAGERLPQHLNLGNQYQPPVQNANNQAIYQNIVDQRPIQYQAAEQRPMPVSEQRPVSLFNSQINARVAAPTERQLPTDMSNHPYLINREETESLISHDEEAKMTSEGNRFRTGIN